MTHLRLLFESGYCGLLAAAYVSFIVLVAHVVGFNHLEDE